MSASMMPPSLDQDLRRGNLEVTNVVSGGQAVLSTVDTAQSPRRPRLRIRWHLICRRTAGLEEIPPCVCVC
jgi:hypothetical protein